MTQEHLRQGARTESLHGMSSSMRNQLRELAFENAAVSADAALQAAGLTRRQQQLADRYPGVRRVLDMGIEVRHYEDVNEQRKARQSATEACKSETIEGSATERTGNPPDYETTLAEKWAEVRRKAEANRQERQQGDDEGMGEVSPPEETVTAFAEHCVAAFEGTIDIAADGASQENSKGEIKLALEGIIKSVATQGYARGYKAAHRDLALRED